MRDKFTKQHIEDIRRNLLKPVVESIGAQAWLVGGCVRDIIHNDSVNDIDVLCTDATGLVKALDTYCINNHIDHAIHVMENGHATIVSIETAPIFGSFPIVPPRMEVEVSQLDGDLYMDAKDRDFVCNAWYIDIIEGGEPFTPLTAESHVYDAAGKYLYTCDHRKSIFDNPLRVYRALDMMCRGYKPALQLSEAIVEFVRVGQCTVAQRGASLQVVHKIFRRLADKEYSVANVIYAFNYFAELGVWGKMIHPVFDDMVSCVHHNKYHHDSVWQHTMNVIQNMATYDFREIHDMPVKPTAYDYWAAFLHDAGKPATMTVADGITHFYEHQTESVRIATEILKDSPLNKIWTDYVLKLIEHHMDTKSFGDEPIKYRQYKYIRKLMWEINSSIAFDHFLLLNHADCAASERTENKNSINVIRTVKDMAYNRGESAWECYKIPITGDDIIEHFPNEPRINIGKYLKQVYKVTFSRPEDYETKEQCIHYIGTLIKTGWVKKAHEEEPSIHDLKKQGKL